MSDAKSQGITELLSAISEGNQAAADRLLPLVYDELRRLASRKMARERAGHTLQATALVHEAYLRLVVGAQVRWQDRAHFFRTAAEAMRRILVEQARRRRSAKHGAGAERVPLESAVTSAAPELVDVLALDEALTRLAAYDRRKSDVVSLRYFAGLTVKETAKTLGVSAATVKSDWSYARAWLHRELSEDRASSPGVNLGSKAG